jgi:hypothetical protein
VTSSCECINESSGSYKVGKLLTSSATICLSTRIVLHFVVVKLVVPVLTCHVLKICRSMELKLKGQCFQKCVPLNPRGPRSENKGSAREFR